ncbi:MAG: substrate-binding domain-containing protein [Bacteroidetes bacterium]|nr:substrate-binding domain-containing protein [Bacteroidota bacterium]
MRNLNIAILFAYWLVTLSCSQNNGNKDELDTTTSGKITISVDESLRPIIESEEMVFEGIYAKADITFKYMGEQDAINYMLKDSARMAIVTRELLQNEEAILEQAKYKARTLKMATDALAIIINNDNNDTLFEPQQIRDIVSGKTKVWKDLNPKNSLGQIQVVFDNPASGARRYLKDSLLKGEELGKNCFAVNSNKEVIEYVEINKNAICIIGVSWISDENSSQTNTFLKKIRVADVLPNPKPDYFDKLITFKPIQANMALKIYPFLRPIFMISREAHTGLGTGFASFVAGDQGQRIIQKSGLIPAKSPIRIIQLNDKEIE